MLGRTTQLECHRCKAWCTLCLNGYSQQVQLSQPCFRTGMGSCALVLLFMSGSVLLPVRRPLSSRDCTQASGRAAVAVAWGPWGGAGMAAADARLAARLTRQGNGQ
jgi:hypothetical protein